ncbi:hypothetical protein D9611_001480 [Ephemerocybe angulata]|uniref:Uncharacterized protein n=1 Tax=Ephemerocybe angulata TaxID=980116 RepID=A0A8H5CIL2_9AGAR|nr:hypothetical protein D9611_001480 [Tulosesus angulatus]
MALVGSIAGFGLGDGVPLPTIVVRSRQRRPKDPSAAPKQQRPSTAPGLTDAPALTRRQSLAGRFHRHRFSIFSSEDGEDGESTTTTELVYRKSDAGATEREEGGGENDGASGAQTPVPRRLQRPRASTIVAASKPTMAVGLGRAATVRRGSGGGGGGGAPMSLWAGGGGGKPSTAQLHRVDGLAGVTPRAAYPSSPGATFSRPKSSGSGTSGSTGESVASGAGRVVVFQLPSRARARGMSVDGEERGLVPLPLAMTSAWSSGGSSDSGGSSKFVEAVEEFADDDDRDSISGANSGGRFGDGHARSPPPQPSASEFPFPQQHSPGPFHLSDSSHIGGVQPCSPHPHIDRGQESVSSKTPYAYPDTTTRSEDDHTGATFKHLSLSSAQGSPRSPENSVVSPDVAPSSPGHEVESEPPKSPHPTPLDDPTHDPESTPPGAASAPPAPELDSAPADHSNPNPAMLSSSHGSGSVSTSGHPPYPYAHLYPQPHASTSQGHRHQPHSHHGHGSQGISYLSSQQQQLGASSSPPRGPNQNQTSYGQYQGQYTQESEGSGSGVRLVAGSRTAAQRPDGGQGSQATKANLKAWWNQFNFVRGMKKDSAREDEGGPSYRRESFLLIF